MARSKPDQCWAIDLGTTNSVAAVADQGTVRVVPLPEVGRVLPTETDTLIPSALHVGDRKERFWFFFERWVQEAVIGQRAVSRNLDGRNPAFTQSFKRSLGGESHRIALRTGRREYTVREAVHLFLKGMLNSIEQVNGRPVRHLTIPAPVAYYETYRAELREIATSLGVETFTTIDEPIAAALGYGVNVGREETLLVVDFGGGTLNLAAVRLGPQTVESGQAPVFAKGMLGVGGNDVDRWLVEMLLPQQIQGEMPDWHYDLRWTVMDLKERASLHGEATGRWSGLELRLSREQIHEVLEQRGLFRELRAALDEVRRQVQSAGSHVEEVLVVGGSSRLPGVAAAVDDAFPDAVVRHDEQFLFTGVALGAARFAGGVGVQDFIYHDYALAVDDAATQAVEYERLIPGRTPYPTGPDFRRCYYADTPGMREMRFIICEVGRLGQTPPAWVKRDNGNEYWRPTTSTERGSVMELNAVDRPVPLDPPGSGTSPRLRVSYEVRDDRWLCATVEDLVSRRILRDREPVVRLR